MIITDAIIILIAILFGYWLRDGNIKRIERKNKKIIEEIKKEDKGNAVLLEYEKPESDLELANKQAKENMDL